METQSVSRRAVAIPLTVGRVHYLDTLRVLAVLMVFVFHATKAFTVGGFLITNEQTSIVASIIFVAFLAPWGMPFFFMLAGAGSWFALQRRSARQFARERFQRLFIPYLVGSALFTPLQAFFEWRFVLQSEGYQASYLQFIFDRWGGWNPTISDRLGYHLWFLIFLFIFSLLVLPLLIWIRDEGQGFIGILNRLCEYRGGILVFAFLPLIIQFSLRPLFPDPHDWADFFYDLFFFLSGYMIFTDERFTRAIRRDWWLVLAVGLAALLGVVITLAIGQAEALFSDPGTPGYRFFWALVSIDAWCWSLFMMFIGMRFLDFSNRWTRYGQGAVVPFYLIHQPVIVAMAFFVVQSQTGVTLKMLSVVFSSFIFSVAIYEFLVRRFKPLRAVFGMKADLHRGA
ncbi:MAG TPA: acyltransferase [Anaerolineales bacterium]|nr:acyltransferase [Anaerolineales bacterium]